MKKLIDALKDKGLSCRSYEYLHPLLESQAVNEAIKVAWAKDTIKRQYNLIVSEYGGVAASLNRMTPTDAIESAYPMIGELVEKMESGNLDEDCEILLDLLVEHDTGPRATGLGYNDESLLFSSIRAMIDGNYKKVSSSCRLTAENRKWSGCGDISFGGDEELVIQTLHMISLNNG